MQGTFPTSNMAAMCATYGVTCPGQPWSCSISSCRISITLKVPDDCSCKGLIMATAGPEPVRTQHRRLSKRGNRDQVSVCDNK